MARNMQPIAKRCKALGISPAVMGYAKKETNRNPGGQMRKKKSEYALQLTEKQKVKFVYGIMEKQFRMYYEKAARMPGKTGENLLTLIERRLDNVVYRLGFAMTRREARQLVTHGHFTVNGQRVDIPSFLVKVGDVIVAYDGNAVSSTYSLLGYVRASALNDKVTLTIVRGGKTMDVEVTLDKEESAVNGSGNSNSNNNQNNQNNQNGNGQNGNGNGNGNNGNSNNGNGNDSNGYGNGGFSDPFGLW